MNTLAPRADCLTLPVSQVIDQTQQQQVLPPLLATLVLLFFRLFTSLPYIYAKVESRPRSSSLDTNIFNRFVLAVRRSGIRDCHAEVPAGNLTYETKIVLYRIISFYCKRNPSCQRYPAAASVPCSSRCPRRLPPRPSGSSSPSPFMLLTISPPRGRLSTLLLPLSPPPPPAAVSFRYTLFICLVQINYYRKHPHTVHYASYHFPPARQTLDAAAAAESPPTSGGHGLQVHILFCSPAPRCTPMSKTLPPAPQHRSSRRSHTPARGGRVGRFVPTPKVLNLRALSP